MVGWQTSNAASQQSANAYITQKYAGNCNISCDNTISGLNIDFVNTVLDGNVDISQVCSVNGQCLFNSSSNALADVLFSAQNSTTSAPGILPGFNVSDASTASYQSINEDIMTQITTNCSLSSANVANNVNVFAENSTIGGSVVFNQTGSTQGGCQFDTAMTATDIATGSATNCSTSGKKAKKACAGKGGGMENVFLYVGAGMLALVVVGMVIKAARSYQGATSS